jgi:hypothetical protein
MSSCSAGSWELRTPRWALRRVPFRCIEVQVSVPAPGRWSAAGALAYVAANIAPPSRENEAEPAEIASIPRASASVWELVPKTDDMRGWFEFPPQGRPARMRGIHVEVAEGIRTLDLLHGN